MNTAIREVSWSMFRIPSVVVAFALLASAPAAIGVVATTGTKTTTT